MRTKPPLFITRFSLSPTTAIGVQTRLFVSAYTKWIHLHWWQNEIDSQDARSHLIENSVLARFSIFKRSGLPAKLVDLFSVGWWQGDTLRARRSRNIEARYKGNVSVVYIAPIDRADARRCRALLQIIGAPFVLHIWDFLDGATDAEEHRWLIENAAHVYCLNSAIMAAVRTLRSFNVECLLFTREPSHSIAENPKGKILRINLIGDVGSYRDGLDLLEQALELLDKRNIETEVVYVGNATILKRAHAAMARRARFTGFLKSPHDRDRALSQSHVSFLPGPLKSPDEDLRSRYSIPSRVLDFLAVATPIIGTVHPASATGEFLKRYDVGPTAFCQNAEQLAAGLQQHLVDEYWNSQSAHCKAAFRACTVPSPVNTLRTRLEQFE